MSLLRILCFAPSQVAEVVIVERDTVILQADTGLVGVAPIQRLLVAHVQGQGLVFELVQFLVAGAIIVLVLGCKE